MNRHDLDHIPIIEGGRLLGVLSKEDLTKWMSLREGERGEDFVSMSEPYRR